MVFGVWSLIMDQYSVKFNYGSVFGVESSDMDHGVKICVRAWVFAIGLECSLISCSDTGCSGS